MNRKQTFATSTTSKKSPTCTQTSEYSSTSSKFELDLEQPSTPDASLTLHQQRFKKKCETERPLQIPDNKDLDLVLNGQSFRLDCSDIWNIENELEVIFKITGIKPKLQNPLKIIVLDKISQHNNNFKTILQKQLEQYEKQNYKIWINNTSSLIFNDNLTLFNSKYLQLDQQLIHN